MRSADERNPWPLSCGEVRGRRWLVVGACEGRGTSCAAGDGLAASVLPSCSSRLPRRSELSKPREVSVPRSATSRAVFADATSK